jgi:hypothetical protein
MSGFPTFTEDLALYVGATFDDTYTIQEDGVALDLSAYTTAKMQVRATHDAAVALVSLTQATGITLGGVAGTIRVVIAAATTAALTAGPAVYDLFIYKADGTASICLRGAVTIYPRTTV